MSIYTTDVHAERVGHLGLITLNRPKALNALSLAMVRELTHVLRGYESDADVLAVVIRGSNKDGPFGAFCAGVISVTFTKRPCLATPLWKTSSQRNTTLTTSSIPIANLISL